MPSDWRPSWDRWVDERRIIIWVLPVSALLIVGVTAVSAVMPYLVYFSEKEMAVEVSSERTAAIAALFIGLFLIWFYVCIGFYQMFFIELRRKFITRQVEWDGSGYRLRGYYFKRDTFQPTDVASVEEYRVGHRYLSSTILTLLTRTPKTNYKVTLKDSRVFYLPGDMERVEGLKTLFESDIQPEFEL